MDALHDEVQFLVHFCSAPGDVLGVLGHFQAAGGDAACIDGLSGCEEHAVMLEEVDGLGLAAHVGNLAAAPAAVCLQFLGIFLGEFVLEGAGESDVYRNAPGLLAGGKHGLARELVGHILHLVAVGGAHDEHVVNHFLGNAFGDVAYAVGAGDGHNLGAQFGGLDAGAPGYVTEAGDSHLLALDVLAGLLEKVLGEVQSAEAGGLRAKDAAAPGAALAGEHAGIVLAGQFLVHAIEVANFTAAHAYVTGRDILVGADAVPQFQHESLAEAHDFVVGFSYGVEVGAALGTAHRKGGESVLERLLEAQEFEHGRRYGFVEAETSLIRTDGTVELDTVTGVGLDLAFIVNPGDAESKDAVRLYQTFHNLGFLELGMLVVNIFNRFQNLLNGLQVLFFEGVFGLQTCHDVGCFHDLNESLVLLVIMFKEFALIPSQIYVIK